MLFVVLVSDLLMVLSHVEVHFLPQQHLDLSFLSRLPCSSGVVDDKKEKSEEIGDVLEFVKKYARRRVNLDQLPLQRNTSCDCSFRCHEVPRAFVRTTLF